MVPLKGAYASRSHSSISVCANVSVTVSSPCTINTFENGKKFISGNRCEKGAGNISEKKEIIKKDPEEVVHIEDNEPEETNDNSGEADSPEELKEVEE